MAAQDEATDDAGVDAREEAAVVSLRAFDDDEDDDVARVELFLTGFAAAVVPVVDVFAPVLIFFGRPRGRGTTTTTSGELRPSAIDGAGVERSDGGAGLNASFFEIDGRSLTVLTDCRSDSEFARTGGHSGQT